MSFEEALDHELLSNQDPIPVEPEKRNFIQLQRVMSLPELVEVSESRSFESSEV